MDSISRDKAIKAIRSLWLEAWGSLDDEQTYETNEYAKGLLDAIDAVDDVLGEERGDKIMNFERGGYQPKGTPDSNCCEPPKGGSAMQEEIVKPMNPYATEDFANAIKEVMKEAVIEVEHNYNEFPKDESKVVSKPIWDMPTTYSGIMRLCYCNGRGAWQDVMFTLVAHGYEVTVTLEDATETEKELDGADKFVVIEYGKVE